MIVYIAGPMTGLPDFNRQTFHAAAAMLHSQGHTVLNPATLPDGLSKNQYMDICIAMLRCADSIFLLKGWEESAGASAEASLAAALGLEISTQDKNAFRKVEMQAHQLSFPTSGNARAKQVASYLGVHISTVWRYAESPDFPKAHKIAKGVTVFDAAAVRRWNAERRKAVDDELSR
ncbi:TPA: DUF4406 domain-containing protein [Klebsiella quasipneumoniae subsp. quasipneumoniae]|nr:DUF4406 domain-containing protein [Klebsiella quasipneumoniae subsp. quasipneumoniae]